jgi:hypothetical protein
MTDAKRKDQVAKHHPNLGQDEAAEEREGKDKMEHMDGDTQRREPEKPAREKERSSQRPAHASKA